MFATYYERKDCGLFFNPRGFYMEKDVFLASRKPLS
jgi:hypothetical protein